MVIRHATVIAAILWLVVGCAAKRGASYDPNENRDTDPCNGEPATITIVCGSNTYTAIICSSKWEVSPCSPGQPATIMIVDGWVVLTSSDGQVATTDVVVTGSEHHASLQTATSAAPATQGSNERSDRALLARIRGKENPNDSYDVVAVPQGGKPYRVTYKHRSDAKKQLDPNGDMGLETRLFNNYSFCDPQNVALPDLSSSDPKELSKQVKKYIDEIKTATCKKH
jgi:hypothetical protein